MGRLTGLCGRKADSSKLRDAPVEKRYVFVLRRPQFLFCNHLWCFVLSCNDIHIYQEKVGTLNRM